MMQYVFHHIYRLSRLRWGQGLIKKKKTVQIARTLRESSITRSYELTNKRDCYCNVIEGRITYQVFPFQTLYNLPHKLSSLLLDRRVQKQPTLKLLKRGGFY